MPELDGEQLVENIEKYGVATGPEDTETADTPETQETSEKVSRESAETPQEKAAAEVQKYKYTARGKEIEEDIDTILKRASMGYDYAQKMAEYKQRASEVDERFTTAQALEEKWKRFDDYAQKNPDWYEHWNQAWANRETANQNSPEGQQAAQMPPEWQQKFDELASKYEEIHGRFKTEDESKHDQALDGEIKSIQETYPNIDFSATDPNTGKSLEQQVIDHAIQRGIPNFTAAFRDFYHDSLVKMERERAREEAVKQFQSERKQGIISKSETPHSERPPDVNSQLSWHQIEQMAANDFGIK